MLLMPRGVRKEEKGSEENGGPLSEKKHVGMPNCEKRSCKHWMMLSEVLECTLKMNGYLPKVSAISRYSC